jgi:hypothetical protein
MSVLHRQQSTAKEYWLLDYIMVLFQMKNLHSWVNPFKSETKQDTYRFRSNLTKNTDRVHYKYQPRLTPAVYFKNVTEHINTQCDARNADILALNMAVHRITRFWTVKLHAYIMCIQSHVPVIRRSAIIFTCYSTVKWLCNAVPYSRHSTVSSASFRISERMHSVDV